LKHRYNNVLLCRLVIYLLTLLWIIGCDSTTDSDGSGSANPPGVVIEEELILEEFPFKTAACAEIIPNNWSNRLEPIPGQGLGFSVISTACWKANVKVMDTAGVMIDSFTQPFTIAGQKDSDKQRGRPGWLVWDGQKSNGQVASSARYLFIIVFDFGLGKSQRAWARRNWEAE